MTTTADNHGVHVDSYTPGLVFRFFLYNSLRIIVGAEIVVLRWNNISFQKFNDLSWNFADKFVPHLKEFGPIGSTEYCKVADSMRSLITEFPFTTEKVLKGKKKLPNKSTSPSTDT